ncbi:MAG: peptide transporter, partial [Pseudomonadota bacterium]
MSTPAAALPLYAAPRWAWLPPIGSVRYYLMLGLLGALVLGPLGGVTASYMNFSIGFFVGGQVLAGILGSTVT